MIKLRAVRIESPLVVGEKNDDIRRPPMGKAHGGENE